MADLDKALQIFSREGEERLVKERSGKINIPYINLIGYPFTPDVLSIVPKQQANAHRVVAFYRMNNEVRVASDKVENPNLIPFLKDLSGATNLKFYLYLCSQSSMKYALSQLEFIRETPKTLERHVISQEYINASFGEMSDLKSIGGKIANTPVSQILDMIFAGAVHLQASDIHVDPVENGARLRFRIDGMLQDVIVLPEQTYKALRNRIKYLSKMKLNVVDQPQDGRFDIQIADDTVDVRVSSMPGAWGEVIVMRLLNPSGALISLEGLGFRQDALNEIEEAISKPNGAIFNTGPTGSGKTTTLYAILQKLNKSEIKIITLEDPIEYRIDGIDQSQVNPQKGYDFSNALKHALRQDPDIIMVGEIRDKETAETALQASLTGHLVLTTLHTNSAPSTIPRLLDLGVRKFLLSGSINLIIAQRLVRKVCEVCKRGERMSACSNCKGTGYRGRIALIETLKISPKINLLIHDGGTIDDFERVAREEGMVTMYQDGMEKVRLGLTTEDEVKRVTAQ